MLDIQRPYAFFILLILFFFSAYDLFRYKKVAKSLGVANLMNNFQKNKSFRRFKISIILRTVLRFFACAFAVFAFAGIFWGTNAVAVQKTGDAVAFVFDISWSMNAKDAPGGLTRLEASRQYAWKLLEKMNGTSVSVVLAKGDGIIAVPLTDDRTSVDSILESLSPALMTAAGSSIGKGISSAMQAFPKNMSQNAHVWVFTDGDETDGSLSFALDDAARFGIPVTLVGFGTARPVEILAGDGVTKVKTFLNAEKMIDAASAANKKSLLPRHRLSPDNSISYVAADSEGSAYVLLNQLSGKKMAGESFEIQKISHHKMFIFLAILFFIFSFIVSELDLNFLSGSKSAKKTAVLAVFALLPFFTSCKSEKFSVLNGVFNWYQKKYQTATANFLRSYNNSKLSEDKTLAEYCAYNLASTYIMQDELDAALIRLEQVSPEADEKLKSEAFYNAGIIANRRGDFSLAREYFKKAVLADSSNLNAKINLEFIQQQLETRKSKSAEKEMTSVNVEKNNNSMENAVFNLIQQEEKERWQKLQSNKKDSSVVDY